MVLRAMPQPSTVATAATAALAGLAVLAGQELVPRPMVPTGSTVVAVMAAMAAMAATYQVRVRILPLLAVMVARVARVVSGASVQVLVAMAATAVMPKSPATIPMPWGDLVVLAATVFRLVWPEPPVMAETRQPPEMEPRRKAEGAELPQPLGSMSLPSLEAMAAVRPRLATTYQPLGDRVDQVELAMGHSVLPILDLLPSASRQPCSSSH